MTKQLAGSPLRERFEGEETRAGFAELFFDLVFVFAVTQLSHFLLHHFTPRGAVGLLLMAVIAAWETRFAPRDLPQA